ncbi:MAG: hypothetical protein HXY50_09645 [Ignavibacteriaceae bacterium]|nr:hypothetical protein [Ignavibacteriaceae bacterium]
MKMDWRLHLNKTLYVTMHENFGLAFDPKANTPIFEIVFKSGKLVEVYEDALMLDTTRENQNVKIYIPLNSIKCVEIFDI